MLTGASALCLSLLAGCVPAGIAEEAVRADIDERRSEAAVDASAPTLETVRVADPVDNAFSVEVPVGWDSVAYNAHEGDIDQQVVTSVSPDGRTVLYVGDPKMPAYWDPDSADGLTRQLADWLDLMELRYYEPAEFYVPEYTVTKFGALPDFDLYAVNDVPELLVSLQQTYENAGLTPPEAHASEARFTYSTDDGTLMNGIVTGVTINFGVGWQVFVQGLATDRTVEDYLPMLSAMSSSRIDNPEYQERLRQEEAAQMARIQAEIEAMTARAQASLAWIQQSAQRHQQRMNAIWAQGDASMQNYYSRMDSMDRTQQGFLNYINEENTVAPLGTPSGAGSAGAPTWQVDSGYDRYWVDPSTGNYLGGDINFGDSQIRELGFNPSDYEEVTVIR